MGFQAAEKNLAKWKKCEWMGECAEKVSYTSNRTKGTKAAFVSQSSHSSSTDAPGVTAGTLRRFRGVLSITRYVSVIFLPFWGGGLKVPLHKECF